MNLTLQVQLTDLCNMKCPYCYVKQRKNVLTFDTFLLQYRKLDTLLSKYSYYNVDSKNINVGFFGGEPLLNMNTMIEITEFLRSEGRLAVAHVQTNGTILTKEIVETLKEHGIVWSYSYDGLWQDNNSYNHDEIKALSMHNKIISNGYFKGSPKIMVSPNSVDTLLENYKYFESLGILIPDFSLVRDDIWNDEVIARYDNGLSKLTNYLIEKTLETNVIHSIGMFDLYIADTLAGTKYGKRSFCCFSGTNGCVITPIGVIYPCTRFYSNDKMPLYDCVNDVLYEDNIKFFQSVNADPSHFEKCKTCKLYKVCNGGCNYSQLQNGSFKDMKPVDSVCEIIKISYKYAYTYYKAVDKTVAYMKQLEKRYFNG